MSNPTTPASPAALLKTETELLEHFVNGESVEQIAAAAAKAPEAVFMAVAFASKEVRQQTFERWRSRQVALLVGSNQTVSDYLESDCDAAVAAAYRGGLLPLESLSAGIAAAAHEKEMATQAAALAASERLEKVLRKLVSGTSASDTAWSLVPGGIVIDEAGGLKLFTSNRVARDFAATCGRRCFVGTIEYRGEFLG
jgi:DNA-binding NarL/FixJ family response regulator